MVSHYIEIAVRRYLCEFSGTRKAGIKKKKILKSEWDRGILLSV